MTLNNAEYKAYISAHLDILYYVGKKKGIIPSSTTFEDFMKIDFRQKAQCRDLFLEDENLLEDYLSENEGQLTSEAVEILLGFKQKISSSFVIYKCYAKHAIFIDTQTNKFYAVLGLSSRFDEMFHTFPVYIDATLIPFKDKIIYDGFLKGGGITFGSNMRASMKEDYMTAKKKGQIIMRL
jgi:hypothetical protein